MIDIHTHILSGVDDGSASIEESLEMARVAEAEGIDTIVATPHHRNGAYDNPGQKVKEQVLKLNQLLEANEIPVTILTGQEIRVTGEMLEELSNGTSVPIHDGRYVLVEFPSVDVPNYTKNLFFDLQLQGYIPVIVHPERNKTLYEHPETLYNFVKNGALTQLTADAVAGLQGKQIKQFCENIIESNLAHFISTDAHNVTNRSFNLRQAYWNIDKVFGKSSSLFFEENARLLVENNHILVDQPHRIKKKKVFGLF